MKLKDIESKLKNEQKEKNIPDVLQRAKKAPINRLLDGQTPLKAFDKQTAVRLLWCAMLLLVTAVLAIWAIAMIPDGGQEKMPMAYVAVSVTSEGENAEFGIVVEDYERVAVFVREKQNGALVFEDLNKAGYGMQSAIKEVYTAKEGDRITICVIASNIPDGFVSTLKDAFSEEGVQVETSKNDSKTLRALQSLTGEESDNPDVLINKYLEKF